MARNRTYPNGGIFPRGFSAKTGFPWPLMPSGQLVELVYGDGLPEKNRSAGTIPVYGTNGQCGWHDASLAKGPGVILGRKGMGPLGVEWCDSDFWVIDTAYYVRPRVSDIDLKYFYYLVKYIGLNHLKDGTSNPSLTRDAFGALLLPKPPLPFQRWVANLLTTFDQKIELNRRMNETLESICRAIFKNWFVDFHPVRAKAALRHQHPKLSNAELSRRAIPNLDPQIAELFPDSFQESALGSIPTGWKICHLGEHTDAAKGLSYKGSGLAGAGLPMHNLNSVYEGGGYKYEGIKFYTGEYKDRHLIKPGEVIVANTEQGHDCLLLGYAAIVPDSFGEKSLFSHHTYRMRIREASPLSSDFLCRLLNSQRMHELVSGYGNGTTVNMLPISGVEQPEFVLAPSKIITAFTDLARNIRRSERHFIDENHRLVAARDALLPKLLSGEISSVRGGRL